MSRQGGMVSQVITKTATLEGFVHANVSAEATLVSTDEHSGYRNLGRTYNHQIVRHSAGEYVKGDAHTNSIEGAWSLLKRQIIGIHHWVSPKIWTATSATIAAKWVKANASTPCWRTSRVA